MIVIPKDLSGQYPEDVTELLKQLEDNYDEEDELDDFYDDSSVIVGCDCGCGGDSMLDSWSDLMDERRELLSGLKELGYVVDGEDYGDDGAEPEG